MEVGFETLRKAWVLGVGDIWDCGCLGRFWGWQIGAGLCDLDMGRGDLVELEVLVSCRRPVVLREWCNQRDVSSSNVGERRGAGWKRFKAQDHCAWMKLWIGQ